MLIEGMHNCEHCKKYFNWYYQVPQKLGNLLDVETIPKDKVGLYSIGKTVEKNGYKIPLEATAYCPDCGFINNINIEQENGGAVR